MKRFYLKFRIFCFTILGHLTSRNGIRLVLNGFQLRIPGRYFHYFPTDYEEDNFLFIKQTIKPGMISLDIGAHIGVYAVCMAQLSKASVFCFEPTPATFLRLKKTLSLNHVENLITPLQVAVSGKTGSTDFYLNIPVHPGSDKVRIAEANSLRFVDFGKNIHRAIITTKTVSIDDFAAQQQIKIDFLKIDAEGSELDILKGAVATIRKDRPSGIVSVHVFAFSHIEKELAAIWEFMATHDLLLFYQQKIMTKQQFMDMAKTDIFDFHFISRNTDDN